MQEEVNQRVVSLSIRTARLTANVLAKAMMKYLEAQKRIAADHKRKAEEPSKGKQMLKELMEQNAGATNVEVDKSNIRSFERIARKYHIDYAVKKDKTMDPPKYFVFFKSRDRYHSADGDPSAYDSFLIRGNRR